MRLASALVTVALVLTGPRPGFAQYGERVDLLTNGGFENKTTGWEPDAQHRLVKDAAQAHGGQACLTGEVVQANQALRLRRSVPVRAGNRYEFSIWARATNGTKLVLWALLPGSDQRTMIAGWPGITKAWRRYQTSIDVTQTGTLQLEIISPSSHGAPPGRIWLDDISLYETRMPPLLCVSDEKPADSAAESGFHDEPTMALASDGSAYIGFNRFVDGADSLQIVRYALHNGHREPISRWQVAIEEGTYLLGPDACPAGTRTAFVYAGELRKNWDVYAVICGSDGPEAPLRVTAHTGVDVKPRVACRDDVMWIVWESNRNGCRQVFATSVSDRAVDPPVMISQDGVSSYDPALVVLPDGEVCVAWHAFRDNNYDLYLRRRRPDGSWRDIVRLTTAPTIDRHACLLNRGNELWLLYENAQTERYHVTRTNRRRMLVAQVTADGLMAPVCDGPSPLDQRCEGARAIFDPRGRLWIAMLKPRLPRAGWDVYLTGFANQRWLAPIAVSRSKGLDRVPGLALAGQEALVAFQSDNMPQAWTDVDQVAKADSHIFLASVPTGGYAGDGPDRYAPLVESSEAFEPAAIRVLRGEDAPTRTITYRGRTLKLYYGDLHEHSDVSICNRVGDQSLDESYQHMRDLARHDFVCITDHGYNFNAYLWNYSAKLARANDDPGRFLTFLGQEWTSTFEETSESHPHGFYGHRNLILADLYFPTWWNARNRQTPSQVWEDLRRAQANFVHIPHQLADTGNVPTDWSFHDETAQPVAEIFQTRGSYEYDGAPRQAPNTVPGPSSFIQDAWARDIVIGVIASPDHGGGYGKACVFAEELSRESILDALRARRCYGTTAAKIFLDVRVNGHLMGEKIAAVPDDPVRIEVLVRCPAAIDKIEVCRNNVFIDAQRPGASDAQTVFVDDSPLPGRAYYYVRVTLEDGEIAWSSPVWFGVTSGADPIPE